MSCLIAIVRNPLLFGPKSVVFVPQYPPPPSHRLSAQQIPVVLILAQLFSFQAFSLGYFRDTEVDRGLGDVRRVGDQADVQQVFAQFLFTLLGTKLRGFSLGCLCQELSIFFLEFFLPVHIDAGKTAGVDVFPFPLISSSHHQLWFLHLHPQFFLVEFDGVKVRKLDSVLDMFQLDAHLVIAARTHLVLSYPVTCQIVTEKLD